MAAGANEMRSIAYDYAKPRVTLTYWPGPGGIPPCTPSKGSVSSKLVMCQNFRINTASTDA